MTEAENVIVNVTIVNENDNDNSNDIDNEVVAEANAEANSTAEYESEVEPESPPAVFEPRRVCTPVPLPCGEESDEETHDDAVKCGEDRYDVQLENGLNMQITRVHIATIMKAIDESLDGREISPLNVLTVAYSCMAITRNMKCRDGKTKLPGLVKREIILYALKKFVDSSPLEEAAKNLLYVIIVDQIPQSIDNSAHAYSCNSRGLACCTIM